jgi:hypothetical protein
LSGDSYHGIRDTGNFSAPTFFCLKKRLYAIIHCKALEFQLLATKKEVDEVAEGFKCKSTEIIMAGCVGALDGLLLLIRTPKQKKSVNVKQVFSGQYQRVGLNVQGLVDCHLCFIYAVVITKFRRMLLTIFIFHSCK